MQQTEKIAREFSRLLAIEIGAKAVAECAEAAGDRNQWCASHDYCDANMVMLAAFESVADPAMAKRVLDPSDGEAASLWNQAWSLACRELYYIAPKEYPVTRDGGDAARPWRVRHMERSYFGSFANALRAAIAEDAFQEKYMRHRKLGVKVTR